jgi:hypothetical protein
VNAGDRQLTATFRARILGFEMHPAVG